jgi:Peptidase family M28
LRRSATIAEHLEGCFSWLQIFASPVLPVICRDKDKPCLMDGRRSRGLMNWNVLMRFTAFIISAFLTILVAPAAVAGGVKQRDLRTHVAVLASDAFEGREPGTAGEQKTVAYIAKAWASAKLKPAGSDGSWFAPVPLVQRTQGEAQATFYRNSYRLKIMSDDIVMIGRDPHYQAHSLPVVFGGYGVKSDGRAIGDMSGKLVLMLASAPDFGDADAMSVAARKDALISAGAEAVLMIAEGGEGNWAAVRRKAVKNAVALETAENHAPLEGAVSTEFVVAMITAGNGDWDRLRKAAHSPDFDGEDLGIMANLDVTTNVRRFNSMNVIGKIPGRKPDGGKVLYMAHWDHLGICRPAGEIDRICNGALDNASGIAVLTEIARALVKARSDRDIYFVATTAEEEGLLGAYSFAANPPFPLENIVIALNIDTIAVTPAGSKVAIIGRGMTDLDPTIESIAAGLGRKIDGTDRANSFLKRQDGWVLTQKGVPSMMVNGSFSDFSALEQYLASRYHTPDDEYSDDIDLSGAAEDADLHIAIGKYFASKTRYPRNNTGS